MLISESDLKRLILRYLAEGRNWGSTSGMFRSSRFGFDGFGSSGGGSASFDSFQSEVVGSGDYVYPVPIYEGVDYPSKMTSPPQEKRTDVSQTTNSETGEKVKRGNSSHKGYDFGTPEGTPVLAFFDGEVISVNTDPSANSGGIYIYISHDDYLFDRTGYMHLSKVNVKKGDSVKAGQIIALSGNTGDSTGPHLHFSIRKIGENADSFDQRFYDRLFRNSKKIKLTKESNTSSSSNQSNTAVSNQLPTGKPNPETFTINNDTELNKWHGSPYAVDKKNKEYYQRDSNKKWNKITDQKVIDQLSALV